MFIQIFDCKLTGRIILDTFEELAYEIFIKKRNWDADRKLIIPDVNGSIT
ncbi:MAG: hypothetical protein ACI9WT_002188 [Flavobacterium sp.]